MLIDAGSSEKESGEGILRITTHIYKREKNKGFEKNTYLHRCYLHSKSPSLSLSMLHLELDWTLAPSSEQTSLSAPSYM